MGWPLRLFNLLTQVKEKEIMERQTSILSIGPNMVGHKSTYLGSSPDGEVFLVDT